MILPWKKREDKKETIPRAFTEEDIIDLAYQMKDEPERFIETLEDITGKTSDSKKLLTFLETTVALYNRSFFDLTIALSFHTLGYATRLYDRVAEASCYTNIGSAFNELAQYQKALEYHEKALSVLKDKRNKDEAKYCRNVGITYSTLGQFQKALEYHEKALSVLVDDRDSQDAASCYTNIGIAYYDLSQYQKALEYHEKALSIYKDIGDREGEASCYTNIGIAYYDLSQYQKALDYYEKALKIAKDIGDIAEVASCYISIGHAYSSLGQFQKALDYYEKALSIYKDIGDREGEASCYGSIGGSYNDLGQFQKALEYHEKALSIYKVMGIRRLEPGRYGSIASVYVSWGQYQKALEYEEKALKIAKDIGSKGIESDCYVKIGVSYGNLGQYQQALEYQEKALAIFKDIGEKLGEAGCYGNIGYIYALQGQHQQALDYYEKALAISMEIADRVGEAQCYTNIGHSYYNLGQYQQALEYQEKALAIFKDMGYIIRYSTVYTSLALIYQINNPDKAFQYLTESINITESMSAMLVEEVHKIGFQSSTANDYELIVPLCLKLPKDDGAKLAFEYVERSKARALIDLLSASSSVLPAVQITNKLKSLIDRENELIARLRQIQTQHIRNEKLIVEPGEVERLRKELEDIYVEIGKYDKQYVSLRKPKPISLSGIQARFGAIGRNAAMVEYFVTQEKTFIFVINEKELHVKEVELTREKLIQCADSYQREIVQYLDHGDDIGDFSLQELSKYLIEPISEYLSNVGLLYFVPHDMLHYIPLHALLLKGEPIIRHYPVVYTPSASLLQYFRTGKGRLDNSASFGVLLKEDELVFAEEAEMVSRLLNCQHFSNATKQIVLSNLAGKDILHFSCHGHFDNVEPLSSGIILHGDKYEDKEKKFKYDILTAREIFNLKERMDADLVTVSACQTGVSDRKPGDELVGLTRSLLYAGASSVVVSLWSVAAHSTMEQMEEFYIHLKDGKDKATALQQAMIKIMMKPEYSHPYFWAPFLLVGDWE
jgi:tetratricopeptide (TPR) repeat protein